MAGLRELQQAGMTNAVRFMVKDLCEWPHWTLRNMKLSSRHLIPLARCRSAFERHRDFAALNLSAAPPDDPDSPCCGFCGSAEGVEFIDGIGNECTDLMACLAAHERKRPPREPAPWLVQLAQEAHDAELELAVHATALELVCLAIDGQASGNPDEFLRLTLPSR
jgi:hypothetical protein